MWVSMAATRTRPEIAGMKQELCGLFDQFFPQDGYLVWGINADADLIAFDPQHGHRDFTSHSRLGAIIVTGLSMMRDSPMRRVRINIVSLLADRNLGGGKESKGVPLGVPQTI